MQSPFSSDGATILAVDTSQNACSAAVCRRGHVLAAETLALGRGHAEHLLPMVQGVMGRASIAVPDLDGYALCIGPGTFTGVRVALSFVKGLMLVQPRPCVALTGFEVIAGACWRKGFEGLLDVVLKARGEEVFHQRLRLTQGPAWPFEAVTEPAVVSHNHPLLREGVPVAGNAAEQLSVTPYLVTEPEAWVIGALAPRWRGPTRALTPLYLKAPDIRPSQKLPPWLTQGAAP